MTAPGWWDHGLALLVGFVVPVLGAWQHLRAQNDDVPAFESRQKIALYWSNSLFLWILAGAVLLVWLRAGRTLGGLGITAAPKQIGTGLWLSLVIAVAYLLDTWRQLVPAERLAATRARWRRDTPFMPANTREIRHSLILVASAAVCEEIVYRGFLIHYLVYFTGTSPGGLAAAIAFPALVFALSHLYQGGRAAAKILILSCLFGVILVVTGSLWIPMTIHFLIDLSGSLLAPKLLASESPKPGGTPSVDRTIH